MAKARNKKKTAGKIRNKKRKTARQAKRKMPVRKKAARKKAVRRKPTKGIAGAASVVMDTIKGTDALRNKLEPRSTSETE